jgi:hypothetical protein
VALTVAGATPRRSAKYMKLLFPTFLASCFLSLNGCNPNTGNTLATNDQLIAERNKDWEVAWTIEAPPTARDIQERINDAIWLYSIDSGVWKKEPFRVTKINASKLLLEAVVDRSELAEGSSIRCYIEYTFDGNREGIHGKSKPRIITIK